jgi:Fe-S-cluster-containing dehydrogenase component
MENAADPNAQQPVQWGKVIDQTRCIGCHACSTACKSENAVPLGVNRTYVKYVDVGQFPAVRRAFQVTRCNQCEHPPCVTACPTSAMFRRPDGIVDFDKSICIGCKACIAACPYDAIFINPEDHSAEKCNFCAHRLEVGLEPACVTVCPTEAILIGDLRDPQSRVAQYVNRDIVAVRRPEKETRPKLFYKGAHQATLDPLAARRPDGGIFVWSEQGEESFAAYVWTKAIAAGSYLVAAAMVVWGGLETTSNLWRWTTPLLSAVFLALTFALLIGDLEHPSRFYLILTRPQWRSWLVRGGIILGVFSAIIGLHLLLTILGSGPPRALAVAGAIVAIGAGTYTAWLFAQAKARDLWQSPLLAPQHLVAMILAGAAALVLATRGAMLARAMIAATAIHLLLIAAETVMPHPTAHASLAVREMVRGKFAAAFAAGVVLQLAGAIGALYFAMPAAVLVLGGLYLYEVAHVGAAQSVPLA